jgi:hypothetical protein
MLHREEHYVYCTARDEYLLPPTCHLCKLAKRRKVEREAGFEPAPQPWKGCALPLSYSRTAIVSNDRLFEKVPLASARREDWNWLLWFDDHLLVLIILQVLATLKQSLVS